MIPAFLSASFLALMVYAVVNAETTKWRLLNFLIVAGFACAGILIGIGCAIWSGSPELGGQIAATFTVLLGIIGAINCIIRNKNRRTDKGIDWTRKGAK